jgi:hypothetical protein
MPNLANEIKKRANAVGLSYWNYVKKYQKPPKILESGFRYIKVDTAAQLELEHEMKERRRKRKYTHLGDGKGVSNPLDSFGRQLSNEGWMNYNAGEGN